MRDLKFFDNLSDDPNPRFKVPGGIVLPLVLAGYGLMSIVSRHGWFRDY